MNPRIAAPIILMGTGAAELVVWADGQGPVRAALAIGFLLFIPGWAILRIADPPVDFVTSVALALGVSVAVDMAVATGLLYLRAWSDGLAMAVISLIVVIAIVLGLPANRAAIGREARRAWSALGDLDEP